MSRPRGYRPVVWLRRVLLVALVAFLGVVAGLLIKSRDRRPGDVEPPAIAQNLAPGEEGEIRTGKGFSHQVTEDGEPRYQIAASSWSSTRDERVRLNDVAIRFNREDGDEYTIKAKSGLYQQSTATATLLGDVEIHSADGMHIRGPGFELQRSGSLIVSTEGPVRFRYQDRFAGTAREVSSNLKRKRHEISGAVRISSLAGEAVDASLTARRLVYEQPERMLHVEGGVTLRRDEEELTARRLSIELDEAGKRPRFVRARWEVAGSRSQVDDGVPQTLHFRGEQLSVLFDDATGEPLQAELEGTDRVLATLDITDAGGDVRRLDTRYLLAEFAAGAIARADLPGSVSLTDFLSFDPDNPLLTGCADAAEARFQRNGELAAITLAGGVEFNRPDAQVSGDVLETRGQEEIVVSGDPARVYTGRGDFAAPEILYRPGDGTGRADGGVRATLARGSGLGLMTDGESAREPINVTAGAARWSDGGGTVTFKDRVRAWQDENFLVADELDVETTGRSIVARGRVKTVIKRAREEGAESGEEDAPIEVTASELDFDGDKDVIHYTGSPKARQAGRTLSCTELDVELTGGSRVERMLCTGSARIESPDDGQTVTGERAVYVPDQKNVEVTGNPVVLRREDGRQVTGARVLYDLSTGRATVLTSPVAPPPPATAPPVGNDGASDDGGAGA